MPAVKLKGPGLNNWFAEMLVKDQGAELALENTSGPMRAAVEAVIAQQQKAAAPAPAPYCMGFDCTCGGDCPVKFPSPDPSPGEKRSEK